MSGVKGRSGGHNRLGGGRARAEFKPIEAGAEYPFTEYLDEHGRRWVEVVWPELLERKTVDRLAARALADAARVYSRLRFFEEQLDDPKNRADLDLVFKLERAIKGLDHSFRQWCREFGITPLGRDGVLPIDDQSGREDPDRTMELPFPDWSKGA